MSDSIIKVENLVKRFGTLTAVDSISFTVPAGEIFGFLGPNGAGKTTTISILCTLLKPTSGTAILNSYDVVRQQNQVSQSIGLVFQDPSLDDRLTGMQNMRFHAMVYNVPSSVREQRIEEVLKMVELWDREFGFLKEVLVAPISRASVSIGKTLGTATIALVQGMLILILAPLIGVSLSVTMVLALIPLMILLSVAMGSFGILLATRIKSMEAFQAVMQMLMLPMMFLSGVFFPVNGLPAWINVLVKINPATYGIAPIRQVMLGTSAQSPFAISVFGHTMSIWDNIAVAAVFGMITILLAMWSFEHQS